MEQKLIKQLIAIDGNSLMHRAYYALPSMTTREGFPTGALHGFLSMLFKLLERKPDYLVVAFDMHGPTFRHEQFEEYKAGRRETPDDLRAQFPVLKDLLREMGIAVCETPRYEADDILGTFSRLCEENAIDALLVTGDRDALQLIGEHTHVLMTKKGISETIEFDEAVLKEHYGLEPDRMRDLKGLMGDNSDNIPGIPGVGEKTALKLLEDYQTLENVLAHADEIKGKLGEKVREFAPSARMSYELGTISTDAPIPISIEDCRCREDAFAGGKTRLISLEMRGIAARLPGGGESAPSEQEPKNAAERVPLDSAEQIKRALGDTGKLTRFAIDAGETITFALDETRYFEIEQGADLFSAPIEEKDLWGALRPIFENKNCFVLAFDTKRLRHLLDPFGIELNASVFDAMIADYLLDATRPATTFAALCERFDAKAKPNASMLFSMQKRMTRELEQAGMTKLYNEMELPLSSVLFDMERVGFRVDEDILKELQARFTEQSEEQAKQIFTLTGETFNILSPKQLGEVLFVKLGLPTGRKNKSGYSTDADTLESLRERHPAIPLILEYRFITKLKSTFVDGLLSVRSEKDGRVRTQFNQCVTATGRISSTEPNMQNIPVRTAQGREIRKAFVASKGNVLVDADYSQIELRLLAHISGDEGMIAAFNGGKDIHRTTASEVFGVPFDEVTGDLRNAAKAVNFGIVYGISDFGLARNLDISVKRASEYIKLYFERYPRVKAYLDESVESAKRNGYAVTMFDRRRSMTELKSSNYNTRSFGERVAMNMPIQGTAADIIKLAMVKVYRILNERGLKTKLILQVHDELIFDTPPDERDEVVLLVHDCMEQVAQLSVPLDADVKVGKSWYETK
ncbi:MAG TPA: DNA polymerase I [Feifaniaceae bacterium]|nr:DNA polymerase I [Feifaniaceae bacterium]